ARPTCLAVTAVPPLSPWLPSRRRTTRTSGPASTRTPTTSVCRPSLTRRTTTLCPTGSAADMGGTLGPTDMRERTAPVTYVIAEPCVDLLDKACIEECP